MEIIFEFLPTVLIPLAIMFFLPRIYSHTSKEKSDNHIVTKTRHPIRVKVFAFIILVIIFMLFVGCIVIAVGDSEMHLLARILIVSVGALFLAMPVFLILNAYRTFEVICEDGILISRLISKKFVKYSDMSTYNYSYNQLTVYDAEHKLIFLVAENRVGIKALLKQLEIKGVKAE